MFAARQSSAGKRRRTALWLLVAWMAFSVSQVYAACCLPVGGSLEATLQTEAAPPTGEPSAQDECCDTYEPRCQVVLDGAPPVPPVTALVAPGEVRYPGAPPPWPALRFPFPAGSLADPQARVPIVRKAPDPLYLRLQRFLS